MMALMSLDSSAEEEVIVLKYSEAVFTFLTTFSTSPSVWLLSVDSLFEGVEPFVWLLSLP